MTAVRSRSAVLQMIAAARQAQQFVNGMVFAQFEADIRTQHAVLMCLVRIGERANALAKTDPDFIDAMSAIPWIGIRGMRNRIVHQYEDVNLAVVWQTVETFIPDLIAELERAIDGMDF